MRHDLVFVAGALRSGTTLFRLMLDRHPEVVDPGEFDFLFDLVSDDGGLPDVHKYTEWLSTHRIFLSHHVDIDSNLGFFDLVKSFVRQKTRANCILALSVHRGLHKIPFLFPDARYIHLLRDPRDVALSTIDMGWAGNAYFGLDGWIETEKSWDRLASKVEKTRTLEVKYEDLVSNPHGMLSVVCNFLHVGFDEDMLKYHQTSTYEPVNSRFARKWKTRVSPFELAMLEHKVSRLLLDRKYELSGVQIRKPSMAAVAQLWWGNLIFKWRIRVRRYGIVCILTEKVARILRMEWLSKRVRMTINEIDEFYLK